MKAGLLSIRGRNYTQGKGRLSKGNSVVLDRITGISINRYWDEETEIKNYRRIGGAVSVHACIS